jgi:hypothetical protein
MSVSNVRRQCRLMLTTAFLALVSACSADTSPMVAGGTGSAVDTARLPSERLAMVTEIALALLGGYEHIISRPDLERLGTEDEIKRVLATISQDPSRRLIHRVNALSSLRFFPDARAKHLYEQTLLDPAANVVLQRSALDAYGVAFPADAVPLLSRWLADPDPHTRNVAARRLASMGSSAARSALQRRLAIEPDRAVRNTMEQGLRP